MLFMFLCVQLFVQVGSDLPPPQNVTPFTLNTNYTLIWDWPQSPAESCAVTFTAQYVGMHQLRRKSPRWYTVCDKVPCRSCDFTAFDLHYRGKYILRVRANMNGSHSNWVEKEFCPDKDAALGPPTEVRLVLARSVLDVVITAPKINNDIADKLCYNIVYWEQSAHSQNQMLNSSAPLVTLLNLKAWTWYCVIVQSRLYNKISNFTSPQCMQIKGNVPWWQYFLGFLGICFVVLFLVCSLFWCYKTIKTTFYPSTQLPPHLKKYLCDSPGSDLPGLLSLDPESELLSDMVTVCVVKAVLEIHNPPPEVEPTLNLKPDSRYSRQDSSSSGDSGVYSTEGSSNLQSLKRKDSGGEKHGGGLCQGRFVGTDFD